MDLAGHCFDLLDFLLGRIAEVSGSAANTGGAYRAEDVTAAAFRFESGAVGTGVWNFNASTESDRIIITGDAGQIEMRVFKDADVIVRRDGQETVHPFRNPPHVHQPLIQTIVDELGGRGQCESTAESGARASWAMDRCLETYRRRTR